MPFKPAMLFSTADRWTSEHAFRFFFKFASSRINTPLMAVYTRRCFSESEGTHFGAPGQKALSSMNEFTLLWIFA